MTPELLRQIDALRRDDTHGAGWLARRAVSLLGAGLAESSAQGLPELERELREMVERLTAAKPTMAPVTNLVCGLGFEVLQRGSAGDDVTALRRYAVRRAAEIAAESEQSVERAARSALTIIQVDATIVTCSYSSAVLETLLLSQRSGRRPRVLIARSGEGDAAYGERLATQLAEGGCAVDVVPDALLAVEVEKADLALIGADAVYPDGSAVNGAPSLTLARAARDARVPLYCVCETSKLDARLLLGQRPAIESGFELVPSSLIAGFCMEEGVLTSRTIGRIVARAEECLRPFVRPAGA